MNMKYYRRQVENIVSKSGLSPNGDASRIITPRRSKITLPSKEIERLLRLYIRRWNRIKIENGLLDRIRDDGDSVASAATVETHVECRR